jgi:hypothetical protein
MYNSVVSDLYIPHVSLSACKLDSSDVVFDTDCLPSTPSSTSACEMNISCSVLIAPPVAVPQVMNSDAALKSVTISETKACKNHFHIDCYLRGRRRTVKTAAMVDSGATVLFLDKKFTDSQKMWQEPLEHLIRLFNIDRTLNEAGSMTHQVSLYLRVGDKEEKHNFYVTQITPERVILGLPWLRH